MFSNHTLQYSNTQLNYYVYKSNKPGKTVLISGGIHGNEANGMFVALEFFQYLKKHSELFSGTIIVAPHLNPEGFKKRNRRYDETDLNRTFTDKLEHPLSKQINQEILKKIDYGIDFHDSGSTYNLVLHARIPKNQCHLKDFINHLEVPFCFIRDHKNGMINDFMNKLNKPFVTIESGGNYQVNPEQIEKQINLILNILKYNGNLEGLAKRNKTIPIYQRYRFKAKTTLLIYPKVKLGQTIKKGDTIAIAYENNIHNPIEIQSPIEGYIIALNPHNLIKQNEYVFGIGQCQKTISKIQIANPDLIEYKHICL